jgi:hypothetical protein
MPRVDTFLLCDAAQVANGKLYVLGGGWARLTAETLPVHRAFDIAIRVVVPWTETNRKHGFDLQLVDEDGKCLLETPARAEVTVGRPATVREGTDQAVPMTIRLPSVRLEREGRYAFTLDHQGTETARTAFDLVLKPPSSGTARG